MIRRLCILILVFTALVVGALLFSSRVQGERSLVAVIVVLLSTALIYEAISELLNWQSGDRGEEGIIKKLEALSDEYTVVTNWQPHHGKRGDVDLIVLGPQGVTAVESQAIFNELRL